MKKSVKWSLVGLIVLGLAGWGYHSFVPRENKDLKEAAIPTAGRNSQILQVSAVVMEQQSLTDATSVMGVLVPDEEVNLTFETSGKITHIYFKEGTYVEEGTLLAKINDAPLQAELRKKEAQVKLMNDRLFRARALLEKEAVSQEAFQEAEANLAALQAEIEGVKANIRQTELRAPFSGVVGLRKVSPGAFATTSTPIAVLTRKTPLKVEFGVPERYAGLLPAGTPISFTVEGDLEPKNAKVYASASSVDEETGYFILRASYENRDGRLVPGRYVKVQLVTQQFEQTLAVPSQAIVSEMGIDKVFVCKNGKAQPVEIKKGMRTDAVVQVLDGLLPGDTVITSGTLQLRAGQPVSVSVK